MKSVKTKIITLVLSCMILSSAAVGGASILNARIVVSEDSTQIMNLLCVNRAEEIDALLTSIEQSVETLKVYAMHQLEDVDRFQDDPDYVEYYTDQLLNVAINAAQNTAGALTVYVRYDPTFTDPQSGLFCSRNGTGSGFQALIPTDLSAYDPSDRDHVGWFYEPLNNRSGTWMSPYFNENIQVEMISYVAPFYMENTFIGVVGMDIDFGILQKVVASTGLYQSGYAFLTDNNAHILYHADLLPGTALTDYNKGEFRTMAESVSSGASSDGTLLRYTYQGTDKKAAFQSLANGMRLVVTAPTSEIDAQSNWLIVQIVSVALMVVAAAVILTVIHTRRLVKPLLELTTAAQKIAAGDLSVSIIHHSEDEVGVLAESFRQTVSHLHRYISYINELAYRDSLTGVKNKTAYLEVVSHMDEMTRLKRPEYAVVVFDINGLKLINDTRGHDFGDILIINAVKLICRVFHHSPVYRIGGDEFVVLLEGSDYQHYANLLQQFQEEVDLLNANPQNELKISVARGIAVFSEENDFTYNDVFKRADSAMYRNKQEMKERARAAQR